MKYIVFDIETDGLYDNVTKMHCFCYRIYEGPTLLESGTIVDPEELRRFLDYNVQTPLVGHNIIKYDVPVLEFLFGLEIKNECIDTLGLSWYLYPHGSKFKHGLEAWGERLGFAKPAVEDWENADLSVYIHRCESDVEINSRLFHKQADYLVQIYEGIDAARNLIKYISFKMDCLKDHEMTKIPLDIRLAEESKHNLEFDVQDKIDNLGVKMPKVLVKSPPKVMYKKDGTLSKRGEEWLELLKEKDLPEDSDGIYENGNPGSSQQLKDWLFELGWQPQTFKQSKATGEEIPQVSLPFGQGLCDSVKDLFDDYPYLKDLEGLSVAKHRLGLFKSYLKNKDDNGMIYMSAHGFTNTLRLQHSAPIVNLPGVDKYYGAQVRGCLKVPNDNYIMCGSDISGLEDNTKQHYIYFFDPDYVNDMRVPGFDPHLDIGRLSGLISEEDEQFFKWADKQSSLTDEEKVRFKAIKKARSSAKVVNFSATYGAGPPKIAKTLDCDLSFATKLHTTYWDRNKAVKLTAKAVKTKRVGKQKWLFNPISKLWYFLKEDKDKFSTLNQGSGVFVFDKWLSKVRKGLEPLGIKVPYQYHDELMFYYPKHLDMEINDILNNAMKETNKELKLNVEIGISIDKGKNYAETH